MYKFSYVQSVAGQAVVVDRTLFARILDDARVKDICQQIARLADTPDAAGTLARLKRTLPAFCWHAWFDGGKRKNYAAHPSGMVMIDVDHVEQPRRLWDERKARCLEQGLLAAHITPSTRGLRLVFPLPTGMDIVQAQGHYVRLLELPHVDACTKDLARLSFCVPRDYFLYLDEERLLGGGEEVVPQPAASPEAPAAPPVTAEMPPNPPASIPATAETSPEAPAASPEATVATPAPPVAPPAGTPYDEAYDGIPYGLLVECLQEQLGGIPAHGSRNNFIFTMAAYLRYVCNDNPDWIASILPTYGEEAARWRRTIDSACQRAQYKVMPQIVKRAIAQARRRATLTAAGEEPCQLPPPMPSRLPRLIAHLVKNVPEVCRPAVANAVFPALAAHLNGVKFWLIDGTEKEATFMCVTMARQSSGKSAVNKPIEYIVADMVERDELNRRREQEWKDTSANRGANKEKPKRPDDLCVQVLVSDMTNAAFVQRMKDAAGRYLYTNLEELDLLKQLQTNGTRDVGKIICLCFDNGKYGQERVGTQSVTARVEIRWNWNASSTIQKGVQFFKGRMVDGTLSRINFCTIIPDKSKPFVYGRYDEQYAEVLKPYIANLNLANGHIECRQALELARHMSEACAEEGALTADDNYLELTHRAVTIAYLKAMVLYIAHDMTWTKEIADFAEWSLQYDLWCKMHFFGQTVREEQAKEQVKRIPGRRNLLELLPATFTLQDAQEVRRMQGMDDAGCRQMISSWMFRGYIEQDPALDVYIKTPKYRDRPKQ